MALCVVSGNVYLPNGELAVARAMVFRRSDRAIKADYLGVVLPDDVHDKTNREGFIEVALITGVYDVYARGNSDYYMGRAVVPEAATAAFSDIFTAASPVPPLPEWLLQVEEARAAAELAADEAEAAAESVAGMQGDIDQAVADSQEALESAGDALAAAGAATVEAEDAQLAKLPPYTPFGSRSQAEGAEIPATVQTLSVGGLLYVRDAAGTALQTSDGASWSPLGDVWAEHFGVVADYDPNTGSGTDNSAAFNAALAWADYVQARPGFYMISDTVEVGPYKRMVCIASPGGPGDTARGIAPTDAIYLIPRNLPRRHITAAMITEGAISGGVVPNPSAGESYAASSDGRLANYRLIDLTNQDAVEETAATPREFSVALEMNRGSVVDGVRVLATANSGALELNAVTDADNWGHQTDIAVLARNAKFGIAANCQSIGSFRIAGLMLLVDDQTTTTGDTFYPQTDSFKSQDCIWQGHKSIAIRGADEFPISGVGADELRVTWFRSHRFAPTGSIQVGGVDYAYTSLTYDSGELVFTGLSSDPDGVVAVGAAAVRTEDARSFGSGGASINSSFVKSIEHPSFNPSTHDGFSDYWPTAGGLLEISGHALRGIYLRNIVWHSREDVFFHLDRISDVHFEGGYHEAKYSAVGGSSARCIALSAAAKAARSIPGHTGPANVHFIGWSQTEGHTDTRPTWRTAGAYGRFGNGSGINDGLFEPQIASNDLGYSYGAAPMGLARIIRVPRMRDQKHGFAFMNAGNQPVATLDGDNRWTFGRPGSWDTDTQMTYQFTVSSNGSGNLATLAMVTSASGNSGFRAQNSVGNAGVRVNGSGQGELTQGGVARAVFDLQGFRLAFPGPYADDAAAIAAGLTTYQCYRHPDGTVRWVQP